jgi:molybdopterin-guanine dinucleotide biosynthesis protein
MIPNKTNGKARASEIKLHKEEDLFVGDEPGKDSYRALERGY